MKKQQACRTLVIRCSEWQLNTYIEMMLQQIDAGTYAVISVPGAIHQTNVKEVWRHIQQLHSFHNWQRVVVIGHTGCEMYAPHAHPDQDLFAAMRRLKASIDPAFNVETELYIMEEFGSWKDINEE